MNSISRPKRYSLLVLLSVATYCILNFPFRPSYKTPRPLTYFNSTFPAEAARFPRGNDCEKMLRDVPSPPFPALLIDLELLRRLNAGANCSFPSNVSIEIAVNRRDSTENSDEMGSQWRISYFENHTETDYLDFRTEPRRIIPKSFASYQIGNLTIPANIPMFLEFWRRAKLVQCRNLEMKRDGASFESHFISLFRKPRHLPPQEAVDSLARLRDELLRFNVFSFLNGGTFLGWYRECDVIAHTSDMDVAVFAEHWRPEFYEFLWTFNSSFSLKRQFGLVDDSYELTVAPKSNSEIRIDIFLMYKEQGSENRWVGGLASNGNKYKYEYPEYDPFCAADLRGRLFWVSCTPEEKLRREYGETWYLDRDSSKYTWYSARNSVRNGKFTREQMATETYNEYKDDKVSAEKPLLLESE